MSNSIVIDHDWNGKALLHLAFWPSPVRNSGLGETDGALLSFFVALYHASVSESASAEQTKQVLNAVVTVLDWRRVRCK